MAKPRKKSWHKWYKQAFPQGEKKKNQQNYDMRFKKRKEKAID